MKTITDFKVLSGLIVYIIFIINWDAHICGKLTPVAINMQELLGLNPILTTACTEAFGPESDHLHTSASALALPAGVWRAALTKGHTLT